MKHKRSIFFTILASITILIYSSISSAEYSSSNYTLSNIRINASSGDAHSNSYYLYCAEIANPAAGEATSANYTLYAFPPNEVPPPPEFTVNEVQTPTNNPTQTITGTKKKATAVYRNGYKVVPIDDKTTWSYDEDLEEGENNLALYAQDEYKRKSDTIHKEITLDTIPPDAPQEVEDDGDYTDDNTKLSASWSESDDGEGTGIGRYEYAIVEKEKGEDDNYIVNWTSVGLKRNVTRESLNLSHGPAYYFYIRAYDKADNSSDIASSDGIEYDNLPQIESFDISPYPSFHQNTTVTLDTTATDQDEDTITYKYKVDDNTIRDYEEDSTATWNPYTDYVMETTLTVCVKAYTREAGDPEEKEVYIFRAPIKAE